MRFVEGMAIAVSRATVPDRPIQATPFPRFTYREALDRFGSDKPDLRFGLELHDLGQARRRAPGFRVFDETLAAGGRVIGLAAPGMAGATRQPDRRADRARAGSHGARGLVTIALAERWRPLEHREVRGRGTRRGRSRRRPAAARGGPRPDRGRSRPGGPGGARARLRLELGRRLGLADPDVLAYAWVHHFPMYQWDAEGRRWDATHNPFSGAAAGGRGQARDRLRRPRPAVTGGPGRPGAGAAVRPGPQRLGARRRLDPDPSPRPAGPLASP